MNVLRCMSMEVACRWKLHVNLNGIMLLLKIFVRQTHLAKLPFDVALFFQAAPSITITSSSFELFQWILAKACFPKHESIADGWHESRACFYLHLFLQYVFTC